MPSASITDIFNAMVALEMTPGTGLVAVHPAYQAVRQVPRVIPSYPYGFRLLPTGQPTDYSSGQPGAAAMVQPQFAMEHSTGLCVVVGRVSEDIGELDEKAARFIRPIIALYRAHYTISGTISELVFGPYVMDTFQFYDTEHYGVMQPMTFKQFDRLPLDG